MKLRAAVSLLVVFALVAISGCGSSSSSGASGTGADPAKLAPSTAPLYVEATVRPDGRLGDDANAALKKLLQTNDPGAKIIPLVDKALKSDGLNWNDDVKPWLGQRLGVFLTSIAGGHPQGALIADATDTGKAKSMLDKLVNKAGGAKTRTYKGVDFTYSQTKNVADGIVDGYAVVGSWNGVTAVVDTSKGGRPLSDVADFTSSRSAVDAGNALAMAYVQPQALIDAIQSLGSSTLPGARSATALNFLRQMVAKAGRAVGVGVHANGDGIRLQAAQLGTPPQQAATGSTGADELAALPGDAWLGIGFGDIGTSLQKAFAQLSQLAALGGTTSSFGQVFDKFRKQTGIDFKKDLLSWMGSGALYGRGHALTDLGLTLSIKSKNPAKSHRAIDLIARAVKRNGATVQDATVEGFDKAKAIRLSGLPFPFVIAAGGNRFSLGLNPQAMTDMLNPSSKLSDSPQYAAAAKALGSGLRPVFLLDTPTIVNLAESFGAGTSASFAKIKKYLDALGPISAGIEHDGDTTKFAFALALK